MNKKIFLLILISITLVIINLSFVFAAINFNTGPDAGTGTNFWINEGAPVCSISEDGTEANWVYYPDNTIVNAINNCSISSGLDISGDPHPNCCPEQYTCIYNETGKRGVCELNPEQVLTCADYTTEEECEGYNSEDIADSIYSILINSLQQSNIDVSQIPDLSFCSTNGEAFRNELIPDKCEIYYTCACEWDATSTGNKCGGKALAEPCDDIEEPCVGAGCDNHDSYCLTNVNELDNKCDTENIYLLTWTAGFINNSIDIGETESCMGGNKEFTCPSVSTIPFFSLFNLVISAIAITLIYFIFLKRKK